MFIKNIKGLSMLNLDSSYTENDMLNSFDKNISEINLIHDSNHVNHKNKIEYINRDNRDDINNRDIDNNYPKDTNPNSLGENKDSNTSHLSDYDVDSNDSNDSSSNKINSYNDYYYDYNNHNNKKETITTTTNSKSKGGSGVNNINDVYNSHKQNSIVQNNTGDIDNKINDGSSYYNYGVYNSNKNNSDHHKQNSILKSNIVNNVHNNINTDKSINIVEKKKNNTTTLTYNERDLLIQMMKYNDNKIFLSAVNVDIVKSLNNKGFLQKTEDKEVFIVNNNVVLLYQLEGEKGFDEIVGN